MNVLAIVVTCLIWLDSTSLGSGWADKETLVKATPAVVTSCGILEYENEEWIILTLDESAVGGVNESGLVMKSLVRHRLDIDVQAEQNRQDAAAAAKK